MIIRVILFLPLKRITYELRRLSFRFFVSKTKRKHSFLAHSNMYLIIKNFLSLNQSEHLCKVSIKLQQQEQFKYLKTKHSFHLVDPSPWPLVASLGALMLTTGGVLYMHKFHGGGQLLSTGFCLILYVMYTWWRDIIREATYEEQHTFAVQRGLRLGMILFIVSEIMFFFRIFLGIFSFKFSADFQYRWRMASSGYSNNSSFGHSINKYFFSIKFRRYCNLGSSRYYCTSKETSISRFNFNINSCNIIHRLTSTRVFRSTIYY